MCAWVAEGRGRVSARRPRCFSLLRQRKVPKRKATPLGVSLRFAAGNLRCSRVRRCRRTRCALAALRSDNCGKSDHEAWASFGAPARLTRCASRHVQRGGKSNSGHRCARPGCRDVRSTSGRVAAAEAAFQDGAPHLRFPFSDSEVKDDTWVWAGSVEFGNRSLSCGTQHRAPSAAMARVVPHSLLDAPGSGCWRGGGCTAGCSRFVI